MPGGSGRVLVVISSAEAPKAALGIRWAAVAATQGWVDRVELVFFGPVEELIAQGDKQVLDAIRTLRESGVEIPMTACKRVADASGVTSGLEKAGLKVGYVGEIIGQRIREGYEVLVF